MTSTHTLGAPSPYFAADVAAPLAPLDSPFLNRLQFHAASRAELRRKRPAIADGSAPLVRFAVLNFIRSR